jgi:hypothetical protein
VNGTDNPLQTLGLISGYTFNALGPLGFGEAQFFGWGAEQLLVAIGNNYFDGIKDVYINGHSHGAGVACCLALELELRMGKNVKLTTLGSPRPGNVACQNALVSIGTTRVYASNDPVPYSPPHTNEAYTLSVILPTAVCNNLNRQVQPPTGWALSIGGVLSQTESSDYPVPGAILSLLNWASGTQCYGNPNHNINSYMSLLQLAVALVPPVPKRVLPAQYTQPEERTRRRANAEERQGEAILAADAENPAGQTQAYQVQPVPATQPRPYRKAKRGGIWVVLFQGEVVAVGPGKRRAGSLARKFNRAARAATA